MTDIIPGDVFIRIKNNRLGEATTRTNVLLIHEFIAGRVKLFQSFITTNDYDTSYDAYELTIEPLDHDVVKFFVNKTREEFCDRQKAEYLGNVYV